MDGCHDSWDKGVYPRRQYDLHGVSVPTPVRVPKEDRRNKDNSLKKWISHQGLKTETDGGWAEGWRWREKSGWPTRYHFFSEPNQNLEDFMSWNLEGVVSQSVTKMERPGQEQLLHLGLWAQEVFTLQGCGSQAYILLIFVTVVMSAKKRLPVCHLQSFLSVWHTNLQ